LITDLFCFNLQLSDYARSTDGSVRAVEGHLFRLWRQNFPDRLDHHRRGRSITQVLRADHGNLDCELPKKYSGEIFISTTTGYTVCNRRSSTAYPRAFWPMGRPEALIGHVVQKCL